MVRIGLLLYLYPTHMHKTKYLGFGRKMYTDYEIICKARLSFQRVFPLLKYHILDEHPCLQTAPLACAASLFGL